ncbi:MAG: sodium:proton antiporter [Candidatus Aureabacteria bacterium]|nr:sodium:proton antiporter [Candidatus Auribacterota bacterium]
MEHASKINLPLWSLLPFAGLLLTIGIMSFFAANYPHGKPAHIWENNRNKLIIALLWALPVIGLFMKVGHWGPMITSLEEYFSFIVLLFSLFAISGGIFIDGDIQGTPLTNLIVLLIGSVLANLVGTTGASMLLIRLFLRINSERKRTGHLPIFFIFLVSNIGGCLLPIGDPPLFLGYLKGVPFFWTLKLFPKWIAAIFMISVIFYIWDTICYKHERLADIKRDISIQKPIKIRGKINFLWLFVVLLSVIILTPNQLKAWGISHGPLMFLREYIMLLVTAFSFISSPLHSMTRKKNQFTFAPILEVTYLFIGIFIAMVPALEILKAQGSTLGITKIWQFFWATGTLSSVLDNAPTYLTFLSLAQGVATDNPGLFSMTGSVLGVPAILLSSISLGAVFMGANTYIGNGPNFMVKAIADEWGYKTPDFFSYILKYSIPILFPVFALVTVIFFI